MALVKLDTGPTLSSKKPTLSDSEILSSLNANGIYTRNQIDRFNKFSRFGFFDPYTVNTITREYLFFTKMDLHLFNGNSLNPEIANNAFFANAYKTNRETMIQLQKNAIKNSNPFCNLLTNTVTSRLDIGDISVETVESAANINGTKLEYPMATLQGNTSDYMLEFEDNKFLDVYMFFRIWYEYELEKQGGNITPPDRLYTLNKVIHDQMACFKIVVGEDFETIIHYTKIWGMFPTSVPRATFSDLPDGPIKISVNFKGQFIEDMDPLILTDFNKVVEQTKNKYTNDISIYNTTDDLANGVWCHIPYIKSYMINDRQVYKLKWR